MSTDKVFGEITTFEPYITAVSSAIAAMGTSAIGNAAIAYYIDDETLEETKKQFEEEKNKKQES